jgi:hypothetical protein
LKLLQTSKVKKKSRETFSGSPAFFDQLAVAA